MSVKHSPSKKYSVPTLAGSRSDYIDQDSTTSDSGRNIKKRKEKETDNVQRADFNDFRKEIMSYLENIKQTNDEFMQNIRSEISEIKTQVSTVTKTIDILSQQQIQFRNDLADLSQSLDYHTKSFDELKTKTHAMSKDITEIKKIEKEVETYKYRLLNVERYLNTQQQRDRLCNIEISGIPEKKNEDLPQLLLSICTALDVQAVKQDITNIYRVPQKITNTKLPKNIVARMSSQLIKDTIISAIRKKKGLTSADLGLKTSKDPFKIYVNEHLTPFNKTLLKKTREAAASAAFQHVWVRNGKIFVRKNDTSSSLNIMDTRDLEKIK